MCSASGSSPHSRVISWAVVPVIGDPRVPPEGVGELSGQHIRPSLVTEDGQPERAGVEDRELVPRRDHRLAAGGQQLTLPG